MIDYQTAIDHYRKDFSTGKRFLESLVMLSEFGFDRKRLIKVLVGVGGDKAKALEELTK